MRDVSIPDRFAVLLARLRALATRENWYQAPSALRVPPLRLQELERVERELGVTLSDPVIAYIVAGVSAWGDGPIVLRAIPEKTLSVRELAIELEGMSEREAAGVAVIDDDSNGNYIAVTKASANDDDVVFFLDHEGGFALESALSLSEAIEARLEDRGIATTLEPFRFDLVDEPEPVKAPRTVRHPKFGSGTVVEDAGEYVTVAFDAVGAKRMKRSYLTFD